MGYCLKSETGDASQWPYLYWRLMLSTAKHYGWNPLGTRRIDGVESEGWGGSYLNNEGQMVAGIDATRLAKVLRKASESNDLEEVSNSIYSRHIHSFYGEPRGLVAHIKHALRRWKKEKPTETDPTKNAHIPVPEMADALKKLALFCNKGAFRIW